MCISYDERKEGMRNDELGVERENEREMDKMNDCVRTHYNSRKRHCSGSFVLLSLFFFFPFLDLVAVFSIQWLLRQSIGLAAAAAAAANAAPLSDLFCTHTNGWMIGIQVKNCSVMD